ncbi:uncharacterized protein isoform X2 [Musca autumnalis]|uniref:uncharacterized protein isoform X2 n=1 Tax=Musca autumnalis TaxID=221902 RepID=UPI003CECC863
MRYYKARMRNPWLPLVMYQAAGSTFKRYDFGEFLSGVSPQVQSSSSALWNYSSFAHTGLCANSSLSSKLWMVMF